ncbi:MAG: hypothetical protein R3Y05_06475 [bacterium]
MYSSVSFDGRKGDMYVNDNYLIKGLVDKLNKEGKLNSEINNTILMMLNEINI